MKFKRSVKLQNIFSKANMQLVLIQWAKPWIETLKHGVKFLQKTKTPEQRQAARRGGNYNILPFFKYQQHPVPS